MRIEKRVGVYVSAESGFEELAALKRYAQDRDWLGVRSYSDRIQLMRDCEHGVVGTVLVWQLCRLADDLQQLVSVLEEVRQREIQFVSIVEGIDSTTSTGRLFFAHVAILANCAVQAVTRKQYAGPIQVASKSQL